MEYPLFSAMQEWETIQETCQLDLLREIELFMDHFQEHDTEKALLTITQKERESITRRIMEECKIRCPSLYDIWISDFNLIARRKVPL
jgi:hypothetical protein